jgi:thiol-disulfide isomerase/thioredoxin
LNHFLRGFAWVLLAGLVLFAGCSKEEQKKGALKAPAFSFLSIDGQNTFALEDFKGKVLIIDFWATWCPPCKQEIPHFNELYETYKDDGLEILGVSVDQGGPTLVQTYMKSSSPSIVPKYPVVMVNREAVTAYGPISSIPVTFIVDRKGNVQQRLLGYQDKQVFEAILEKLL